MYLIKKIPFLNANLLEKYQKHIFKKYPFFNANLIEKYQIG